MGFERNYRIKIPSKQFVASLQNKNFSINSQCKNLFFSNICDTSSILPVSGAANSLSPTLKSKGWTDANLFSLNPWLLRK